LFSHFQCQWLLVGPEKPPVQCDPSLFLLQNIEKFLTDDMRNEKQHRSNCRKPEQLLKRNSIDTYLQELILTTLQHRSRSRDIVVESPRFTSSTIRYSCDIFSPFSESPRKFHEHVHFTFCVHLRVRETSKCMWVRSSDPFLMKR
jgi:hypothetical protein